MGMKEKITEIFFDAFGASAKKRKSQVAEIQRRHKLDKFRVYKVTITETNLKSRYCQAKPGGDFDIFTSPIDVDYHQEVLLSFKTLINLLRGNIDIEYAVRKGLIKVRPKNTNSYMQMRFTGDSIALLDMLKLVLDDVRIPFKNSI